MNGALHLGDDRLAESEVAEVDADADAGLLELRIEGLADPSLVRLVVPVANEYIIFMRILWFGHNGRTLDRDGPRGPASPRVGTGRYVRPLILAERMRRTKAPVVARARWREDVNHHPNIELATPAVLAFP